MGVSRWEDGPEKKDAGPWACVFRGLMEWAVVIASKRGIRLSLFGPVAFCVR